MKKEYGQKSKKRNAKGLGYLYKRATQQNLCGAERVIP